MGGKMAVLRNFISNWLGFIFSVFEKLLLELVKGEVSLVRNIK
jgi:hypothetical protein